MKIALFGGAFNPPHLGHVFIARQVKDYGDFDEVWLLPNYAQSPPKPVAAAKDRLAMTSMVNISGVKVSTLEMDHALDGKTMHLLPHLPSGNEYSFVIGSDQLPAFHLWWRWEELLDKMPFVVFPRYGYPSEPLHGRMRVLTHEHLIVTNLSSSKVRARVQAGLPIDEFVPRGVADYIKEHSLYLEES